MIMRKTIIYILVGILLSINISGCKSTKNIHKYTSKISIPDIHNAEIDTKATVRIYFPELYNNKDDVYIGDGIVIILPDGKTIVIDGFETTASEQYEQFIRGLGISKIDYLIGSHWHIDHIGTFSYLIEKFPVGAFYSCGARTSRPTTTELDIALKNKNIPEYVLKEGDKLSFNKDTFIEILWPNLSDDELTDVLKANRARNYLINDSSLVFKFNYHNFSALFTGDVYIKSTDELVKKYGNRLKANILKVPHHGDVKKTNKQNFINAVSAEYAFIQDNRYITDELLSRYTEAGTKILYLLHPGYYKVETDGKNYNIKNFSLKK